MIISYPWPHLGIITAFITEKWVLDYDTCLIERSRRTSNPAGRSSRISNSAGRLLCVTWFELFSQLATPRRSYARKIRNHSCGGPVEWKNERTREYLRSERPSRIRPLQSYPLNWQSRTTSFSLCPRPPRLHWYSARYELTSGTWCTLSYEVWSS